MHPDLLENPAAAADNSVTPMMRQYLAVKNQYPDYLVFYRMGDFYELFFDDAVKAAACLDIALTRRGKHENADIPMCGVPHHSSDSYLEKLIRAGFKVVIAEQMETPEAAKKRGAKSVIRREVIRIVTPGTITEDTLLDGKKSNFLAALATDGGKISLAWVDISTGFFSSTETSKQNLGNDLARIAAKEILVPAKLWNSPEYAILLQEWKPQVSDYADNIFEFSRAERKLKTFFGALSLEVFGHFSRTEVSAAGALLEYIELTQQGKMPRISGLKNQARGNFLGVDQSTRRNLEIFSSLNGDYRGSLLSIIDRCRTGFGARLLAQHLATPLLDPAAINQRLDAVQFFYDNDTIRAALRGHLAQAMDMERALSRLSLGRGGPRDLLMIRRTLEEALKISAALEFSALEFPALIKTALMQMADNADLIELLTNALEEIVPFLARDGGFILEGYNAALDNIRRYKNESESIKSELREKYRNETRINNLKVGENNLIGFFIEVTSQHLPKVPDYFIHRQTMSGAARYTTPELREIENRIINAKGQALGLELELFAGLVAETLKKSEEISLTAQALAALDVSSALAELAAENNYARPVVDSSLAFDIKGGRHPVVEALNRGKISLVPNDCNLESENRLWILTGPNMAGKSTFLRQNALIAILAQTGSFVPAKTAHIGIIDRLFSRVGASDNLARGQSTFMVEMVETAAILNQATEKSLVILDEIGRGTATYDGLSIAWAVVEYLHNANKSRGIFATHYHELTALAGELPNLAARTIRVKEWEKKIIFLYEVTKGNADKSYGIHVAEFAGLPKDVTGRAAEILKKLENKPSLKIGKVKEELDLFSKEIEDLREQNRELLVKIKERLGKIPLDSISPREAINIVYDIKDILSAL